ncbi:glycoside hydrolase family 16 protein [Nocardioides campestrisoli]|uniref:glycoside hydrolase family 16 protein n=1 Tax=Nocardioides campestrisoli TaxID=2736757 RepID=UPI0015E73526|nr:glycoside hydrolase family 16 protein [Nocardioides campestrisoli]
MSGRRIVAATAAALLLPAAALVTTSASSASEPGVSDRDSSASTAVAARKKKKANAKIKISVLPQIAQYGKKPASPDAAKAVVEVQVKPLKRARNKKVVLQAKVGSSWKKAGKGKTDKRGRTQILTSATRGGQPVEYRVKLGNSTSKSASTAAWLAPNFTDGFDGSTLSPSWTHRIPTYNAEGNRLCSRGGPEAVSVGGGTVRLSVIKDPARSDKCVAKRGGKVAGKFSYRLNGHISTENSYSFKYGIAAARMKFPKARGQHSSFWMQPAEHVSGATDPKLTGAEIDVIEHFGKGSGPKDSMGLTSFTYHWAKGGQRIKTGNWLKNVNQYKANKNDDWFKAYHVFSVEWTPKQYIFRIDGKETWRSNRGVSGQPQYPILSLLSSDYELNQLGNEKKLPQHMFVDWIRVWETN